MGKIAVDLATAVARRIRNGSPGRTFGRRLGEGDGWVVEDVICSSGPQDRPFEEQHHGVSIALVAAGTFQYRTAQGRHLMTPGSLMLGNPGQHFECGHEHADGDRCVSFRYRPDVFESIAADAGVSRDARAFRSPRLPQFRELSRLYAKVIAGAVGPAPVSWEELSITMAATAVRLASSSASAVVPPGATEKVTRVVRLIDQEPAARLTLSGLASRAKLSPYHFLRIFHRLTGTTPHQFVLRARLREAAVRLAVDDQRVIDVAFECGFGDLSNFNQAFRAEFGVTPRSYRSANRKL